MTDSSLGARVVKTGTAGDGALHPARRGKRGQVRLLDAMAGKLPIDDRRNLVVRARQTGERPLDHRSSIGRDHPKLDLGASAKALVLRRAGRVILHTGIVEARVHCLVQNSRRNLRWRELAIDDERQLDETGARLGKVRAAAGEAADLNAREVAAQTTEVRRLVSLDQLERRLEAREDILAVDVPSRVDERDGEAADRAILGQVGASTTQQSF